MSDQPIAFAARSGDRILVETVSPTRRAVMVNWLVVFAKVPIMQSHTDEEIVAIFEHYAQRQTEKLEIVSVEVVQEGSLSRSAILAIMIFLNRGDGSAFIHDTELAAIHPATRLVQERDERGGGITLKLVPGGAVKP